MDDEPTTRVEPDGAVSDAADPSDLDNYERSSVGRNLFHMMTSQVLTWALAFALTIVQPRLLGPAAIGQLRLAVSLWLIASVFITLGTTQYHTLNVARDRGHGIEQLGTILVLRSIVFAIASAVFTAFLLISDATAEFSTIMAIFGVAMFFATITDAVGATFIGLERMSTPAATNVIVRIVGTVLAITVLLLGGDVVSVVIVAAVSNLLGLVIIARALGKLTRISVGGWRRHVSTVVKGSIGFLFAIAILTLYQQIDTVVIALLVDQEELGWYGTADTLFSTLLFPITILMGVYFPLLGRLYKEDPDGLVDLVRRSFKSLLIVAIPIGLGTLVIAPEFAPLLLGEDFRETGAVLAVFGPVIILTFGSILFGTVAMATERQRFWNIVMFTGVLMTIPLDLWLVPWADRNYSNGAIGGALAYLVTETMMVTIGLWKIAPYLVERATLWRVARNLVAGAALVAASWPLRDRFLAIPILAAASAYVAAVFLLGIVTDEERRMLGKGLAKVGISTSWANAEVTS